MSAPEMRVLEAGDGHEPSSTEGPFGVTRAVDGATAGLTYTTKRSTAAPPKKGSRATSGLTEPDGELGEAI